jgi:NADPH:quinone reductase-like Zn-dependent oxidoreductase
MLREGYLQTGPPPLALGCDLAGIVADVREVDDFQVGDEVYGYKLLGNGTYAEYAAVEASLVAPKPRGLSFAQAAALPCAGLVALDAIAHTLKLARGETILIAGASGGVGHLAVQIARARGARVIATAGTGNLDFVRSLGADAVIDHAGDVAAAVRRLSPGGVDAALPTVRAAERSALGAVRDGGRITWINNGFEPRLPRGISGRETNGSHGRELLDELTALVQKGALAHIHLARRYSLDGAAQAQRDIADGHTRGKLVIDVTDAAAPTAPGR